MSDATRALLLRAIVEEPEADDVRLIYADWLADHGEPERAEFIRLQIRLASMDEDDEEYPELQRRERDLLADNRHRWMADLPGELRAEDAETVGFRRGFPETLALDAEHWLALGEAVLAVGPVTQLRFQEGFPAAELASCPTLAGVRHLSLPGGESAEDLAVFLGSPWLRLTGLSLEVERPEVAAVVARWPGAAGLWSLRLHGWGLGREGLAALVASPYLRALRRLDLGASPYFGGLHPLDLWGCPLDPEAVSELVRWELPALAGVALSLERVDGAALRLLAGWPALAVLEGLTLHQEAVSHLGALPELPRLRRLFADSKGFGPSEAEVLAGLPQMRGLRLLWLLKNPLGDEGVARLAASPYLGAVRELVLGATEIGDAGVQALAASTELRPVRLHLGHNAFGSRGMATLAASPVLERVHSLDLNRTNLGDDGLAALARGSGLRRPGVLRLCQCGLHDEGAVELAQAGWARELRELTLATNAIGDRGGVALVQSANLAQLRSLELGSTEIGNATALALAASPHAGRLRSLSLGHSRIGDEGARALAGSPHLEELDELFVWHNPISRAGMEALWARFGDRVYPQRQQLDGSA